MNSDRFVVRRCVHAGVLAVEAHSSRAFPRHRHDRYGIGLITDGAHRSWSGRGNVEAQRGDLITCNPEEVHDGLPIGSMREWKMLYLTPELVASIAVDVRESGRRDFEFCHPVITEPRHRAFFTAAYHASTNIDSQVCTAEESLLLLLGGLLRKTSTSPPASATLALVKARIDDDPLGSHTLDELARVAQMSRFQLIRGFCKLTGFTPHGYVLQRRIEVARALIATGASLVDAALGSGFADQAHFTRAFVARHGVTPSVYADHASVQFRSRKKPTRTL